MNEPTKTSLLTIVLFVAIILIAVCVAYFSMGPSNLFGKANTAHTNTSSGAQLIANVLTGAEAQHYLDAAKR